VTRDGRTPSRCLAALVCRGHGRPQARPPCPFFRSLRPVELAITTALRARRECGGLFAANDTNASSEGLALETSADRRRDIRTGRRRT
jgi:hypothetical protein